MFLHYRTQGIILEKIDRGEADQLLTIFTKDFGKLEILARAVRKISSKLRSGAELFYLSEIEFIQGKTNKTLTDAVLIEKFKSLRGDLTKLKVAYKIAEDSNSLIKAPEPDEKIWNLLNETLQKLNNYKLTAKRCILTYYYFLWNLLSVLGYQPELYRCCLCQTKLKQEQLFFSHKEGGVLCQNCGKSVKSVQEIKPDTIKILRILLAKNWRIIHQLKIENYHLKLLNEISKTYLL